MSRVLSPTIIPVNPPVIKVETKPIENNMAGFICKFPLHKVVIQLKAFTAEGIAINRVVKVNTDPKNGFIPETNMWCPQTIVERNAIAKMEATIARYPKMGFRAFVEIISETSPIAGRITIYTSGCPRNQNKCSNKTGDPPSWCNTSPWIKISDKKKEVPKLLSIISRGPRKTVKERKTTPIKPGKKIPKTAKGTAS